MNLICWEVGILLGSFWLAFCIGSLGAVMKKVPFFHFFKEEKEVSQT